MQKRISVTQKNKENDHSFFIRGKSCNREICHHRRSDGSLFVLAARWESDEHTLCAISSDKSETLFK